MINLTNKQKRYVVTPTVPDGTVYIDYYVYWGQPNTPIYSGKSRFFGEFEIDLTDWVEWVYSKYNGTGVMTYYGDLIVDFVFIDEDGTEHQGPEDRYTVPVTKDDPMVAYEPSVKGVVDIEAPLNTNLKPGIPVGGKPQLVDSYGVWVYPVFFLENIYDGRKAMLDTLCLANTYGEHSYNVNIGEFWTTDSEFAKNSLEFTYDIINLLDSYDATYAEDHFFNGFEPTIWFEDGNREVYTSAGFAYPPLAYFWDMEDYDTPSEGHYSYILKQPYSIRFTEEQMREWYNRYITLDIRSDYRLDGFGFSVVYIYPQYLRQQGDGNNPMRIDYHLAGRAFPEGDCPWFNLLLINSDLNGDINVPLAVTNSVLRGKTVNNLDKISFMDRYGDTHNASISNSYELECYVDPDWLKTSTGNDLGYEAVMAAMQSARKTLLIGTAKISGMRTDDLTMLNCRVKDVEKVETYSRYNGTHRVPSLKITIEIYK